MCKELEDYLVPQLNLTATDRPVYYHLLRRTHWEGKLRVRFTGRAIGAQMGLSRESVRNSVRRMANHGLLRIVERDYNGTLVEVRLPNELRAASLATNLPSPSKLDVQTILSPILLSPSVS